MIRKSSIHGAITRRALHGAGLSCALAALVLGPGTTARAAGEKNSPKPIVFHSIYNDVSPALRDLPAWPVPANQKSEAAENPLIRTAHTDSPDLVVQKGKLLGQLAPSIPPTILNFAGIPFPGVGCSCAPPDTNGEVGTTQYVQIVNEGYQVFDKATGASILGPNSIGSIWVGMGGVCQTGGNGDPIVLYDQIAHRWLISQFANGLHDECIAVSTADDATGSYNRYDFPLGTNNLFDYPHLGVWPDAYYMAMNLFNSGGTAYLGPQPFAFDRAKMLAGQPATMISFPALGGANPPMLPSDLDGNTLPPNGAPNSFVLWPNTNTYRTYHFHVDFATPTNSTFTLFASPPAAGFTQLCPGNRNCVPQLGGLPAQGNGDDALADRLMFRLAYRNFTGGGAHESLVGNFTVNSGGVAGIRFFELRGVTSGPETTFQEGTYQPDSDWRWMGSIAMDGQGNMALGYSASSPTIHPQIRYTGRMSTDPLGTLPLGEGHIKDGNGSQVSTGNRWGDYSDMTVDPVDDATFWYTQEYYDSTSSFNWRTQIASFKLQGGSGGGENIVLTGNARSKGTKSRVTLTWSPAENDGNIDIMRDGAVVQTTADDGKTTDNLRNASGTTHTYQVCETDGGGCSNTITVTVP